MIKSRLTADQLYELSLFREPRNGASSPFPLPSVLAAAMGCRGRITEEGRIPVMHVHDRENIEKLIVALVQ
eukprot:Pgem_evm1s12449